MYCLARVVYRNDSTEMNGDVGGVDKLTEAEQRSKAIPRLYMTVCRFEHFDEDLDAFICDHDRPAEFCAFCNLISASQQMKAQAAHQIELVL